MKRYEFNLGSALRVRKLQEGMAKSSLQKANMAAAASEMQAQRSLAHYEDVTNETGPSWMEQAERAHLAAQAAIEARQSLAAARAAATTAMGQYVEANKAVSVLGHLDERRREEHAAAVQHEEMTAIDDLVTSRHVRRQDHLNKKGRH